MDVSHNHYFPVGIIAITSNKIHIISFFTRDGISIYLVFTFRYRDKFINLFVNYVLLSSIVFTLFGGGCFNMPLGMIFLHIIK